MKKVLFTVLMMASLLLILLPSLQAVSIGVSPGKVIINDLLRGGYAEKTVTISSSIDQEITAHYEVEGEIKDWISFVPKDPTFIISKNKPYVLKIIVEPPSDAVVRAYSGQISFITDSMASVEGGIGSTVRAAIISTIELGMTDKQIVGCRGGGFSIPDTEVGMPLLFQADAFNEGNVRLEPVFMIDIWDQAQERKVYSGELKGAAVLPTTPGDYQLEIPADLEKGQYWANVLLRTSDVNEKSCWVSDFITFNVYEKGAVTDKGSLEKVSTKVWANVGEIVEILATFKNLGTRTVDAKFTGTVSYDDEIISLLESETLRVNPGETIDLVTYFTPARVGRYVINGKVLYNNKLTFEKGAVINVTKTAAAEPVKWIPILIYILIFVIIIFLLFKIRKERKRYR
jgi:hypothetical protein